MPRNPRVRKVRGHPASTVFKPAGVPKSGLSEVVLTLDEFEAVRLSDLEGLYQDAAAGLMEVSRQTFGNILNEAHRKIADCLVNGKALRIEGGTVDVQARVFECGGCSRLWPEPHGTGRPGECPGCGSPEVWRRKDGSGCGRGAEKFRNGDPK